MKVKRLVTLFIGIASIIAVMLSCLFIFSIKSVSAEFTLYGDVNEKEIKAELDKFNGRNLLFLDEEEVYSSLSKFTNVKVISVEKSYPNVISVKVVERVVLFAITIGDDVMLVDNEGFLVDKTKTDAIDFDDVIVLKLEGEIAFDNLKVGENISTTDNALFYSTLNMASSVSLDSICEITVKRTNNLVKDAIFLTRSGVSITINKPKIRGEDKILVGFNAYHNLDKDFLKTYETITVVLTDDGRVVPVWTQANK